MLKLENFMVLAELKGTVGVIEWDGFKIMGMTKNIRGIANFLGGGAANLIVGSAKNFEEAAKMFGDFVWWWQKIGGKTFGG